MALVLRHSSRDSFSCTSIHFRRTPPGRPNNQPPRRHAPTLETRLHQQTTSTYRDRLILKQMRRLETQAGERRKVWRVGDELREKQEGWREEGE